MLVVYGKFERFSTFVKDFRWNWTGDDVLDFAIIDWYIFLASFEEVSALDTVKCKGPCKADQFGLLAKFPFLHIHFSVIR